MKVCDLHTHSSFSDGSDTPRQLLANAERLGLSAVALCDHNTVDALEDFLREDSPVEAIPGAEFSVDLDGTELHLLGLFLPRVWFGQITGLMEAVVARKEQSNLALIEALNRAGYPLDYALIKSRTPKGIVNRNHIGKELTRLGYTESIDHAFATLLSEEAGYYRPPLRLTVWEMLGAIRDWGGVPVLAHPLLNLSPEALTAFLPQAKQQGLVGMECLYSSYNEEKTAFSLALAERFGLLTSGGSDYHGKNKPVKLGFPAVPLSWMEALRHGCP